jgi:hypothetical protein
MRSYPQFTSKISRLLKSDRGKNGEDKLPSWISLKQLEQSKINYNIKIFFPFL